MKQRLLALLALLLLLCGPFAPSARASELRRVAIVVGANLAPPGRVPLRYAHEDAERVRDVLLTVAGFAADDVKVLLDPTPDALLAALDQELGEAGKRPGETLLFFYYSGHADDRAIFPQGQTLAFSALRTRLEDKRAKLRVGLVDSCRGGSWTGAKGLKKVEPFEVDAASALAEEGSVLIASSSGQENAHETEALHGSFFTHYWNAGLRGAADRDGDGVVTLNEAFEYARTLTIRDTALAGQAPQHPSFQMKLAGRRDFPVAMLAKERTTLLFEQSSGPVEFVRLSDGLVVVESTPGARQLRLGLPVGSYLVRRRTPQGVWASVVSLSAGGTTRLNENELEQSAWGAGRTKDAAAPLEQAARISWQGERLYASVVGGVRHAPIIDPGLRAGAPDGSGVFMLRASARVARRLWLSAPLALVFDAERASALNFYVWGGAPVLGFASETGAGAALRGFTGAGADLRVKGSPLQTFNASLAAVGAYAWTETAAQRHAPSTWTTQASLGISEAIAGGTSFNLGVAASINPLIDGAFSNASAGSAPRALTLSLGSVQRAGLRPLPLIHVPLSEALSVDAHAAVAYLPWLHGWVETYTAGLSYAQ